MDLFNKIFISNPFKDKDDDSDFAITVGGLTLNVHSFLLSRNSPVFANAIVNNVNQWNITNSKAEHVIEFLKFFYAEYGMNVTDNTAFQGILKLSKEFQTVWLSNRISAFFLNKSWIELEEFGLDVIYYADQFNLDTLKHTLLNNNNFIIPFTAQEVKKKNYVALTNETKFKLARKTLAKLFQTLNRDHILIAEFCNILDGIQEGKQPLISKTPFFPFINIFKNDEPSSDIVVVIREHRFYLHRQILKRFSPKFKQLLKPAEEHPNLYELKLEDVLDEKAFLLMVQNFYSKFHFQISEQHPIKSLYKICTYFEVEWMKEIVLRRVDEMTDYRDVNSRLKTLQLAAELNAEELKNKLLESLRTELYPMLIKEADYRYLDFTTRYLLARCRIRTLEKSNNHFNELFQILEELDKIVLINNLEYIDKSLDVQIENDLLLDVAIPVSIEILKYIF